MSLDDEVSKCLWMVRWKVSLAGEVSVSLDDDVSECQWMARYQSVSGW